MTARPIWPSELLRLAERLAGDKAGRGRPQTAELRRAVSTAYYALFHELTNQATRELVGADRSARTQRHKASRWFAHTDVKSLAEAATGARPAIADVLGPTTPDLVRIADTFLSLQAARHRADYDHDYDIKRRDALLLIRDARDAIERARRLRKANEVSYRRFLKLMVGAVKIAKDR